MKWIKCKDKFPQKGQKVLVFYDNSCMTAVYGRDHEGNYKFYPDDDSNCDDEDITHWMTLPKDPNEKK